MPAMPAPTFALHHTGMQMLCYGGKPSVRVCMPAFALLPLQQPLMRVHLVCAQKRDLREYKVAAKKVRQRRVCVHAHVAPV
jgi:hypothetical protein